MAKDCPAEEKEVEGDVEAAGAEGNEREVGRHTLRVVQQLENGQPENIEDAKLAKVRVLIEHKRFVHKIITIDFFLLLKFEIYG